MAIKDKNLLLIVFDKGFELIKNVLLIVCQPDIITVPHIA
jgi:hypothetical protein